MKIENNTKELRLDFFRSLYERAALAYADFLTDCERNMAQYRGDTAIDGSTEAASTVRNITYEIVESQVSSDVPMPKADATSYSERRERNAASIERLCRAVRNRLPFDELNDVDERYTYIYGGSVWYVEWDNDAEYLGEVGTVRVRCLSPRDVVPQPGIYDVRDMEYLFLKFTTTRGELARKYGLSQEELEGAQLCYEFDTGVPEGDAVSLIVCFYKDDDGDVCRYVFTGEVELSHIPKYYYRKGAVCPECGAPEGRCECGKEAVEGNLTVEYLERDVVSRAGTRLSRMTPVTEGGAPVLVGGELLRRPTALPYYVPRDFPIAIRRNTSDEGRLFGGSDCEYVRPEQQAINKIESRILEKLIRAGVTPIVPEDATVTMNNTVFGQVIRMKPGESAAQYGKVDTTPDVSQDIAEAERLYDHAKRVIGISDAYQGIDTGMQESGVAKQLRISQARGRLESKRRMKEAAYAELDRIVFLLYLAFADEPRRLCYKDAYGRIHSAEFNRYDFVEYDPARGEYYLDDGYLFSADRNEGAEYEREALWQRNLENLKAGTLGDPTSAVTLLRYWQCQERAHYPFARENVEYFTDEVRRMEGVYGNQGFVD